MRHAIAPTCLKRTCGVLERCAVAFSGSRASEAARTWGSLFGRAPSTAAAAVSLSVVTVQASALTPLQLGGPCQSGRMSHAKLNPTARVSMSMQTIHSSSPYPNRT